MERSFNLQTKITDLVIDSNDNIYFVSLNRFVCNFKRASYPDDSINQVFCSEEGIMTIELSVIAPNEILITTANGNIILLDVKTCQIIRTFSCPQTRNLIRKAIFGGHSECFVLMGTEKSEIYVWDRNLGTHLKTLSSEHENINSLSWKSQDEQILATCTDSRTIM